MKKDQNLPNKNIHSNNSSGKPLPNNSNYSRHQSRYNSNYRGRSANQRIYKISHKTDIVDQTVEKINIETNIQERIQAELNFRLKPVPIHTLAIDTIPMIDQTTPHIIEIEFILAVEIETIQKIEIKDIKTIDHVIILTTDQTIKDQVIKIDHAVIHINSQRNYSQSPHRINTRYPDSQQKFRINTRKHQRQINQVQTTEEVQSDPLILIIQKA